jgi:glycosyltransferase involved in cell wall biosynthesis
VTLTGLLNLTVVIPTLDAAGTLARTLGGVGGCAVVVADGGSRDGTAEIAAGLGALVVAAPRGRGAQLAAGVATAGTAWVLLLHADTRLDNGWRAAAEAFMGDPDNAGRAGYFRFALDSEDRRARRLERMVAWRCRFLGLPYGDQGLLVARATLAAVGGIRPLPLMEDVDLAQRLGGRLVGLAPQAVTSAARWEAEGWYRRSARNLLCLGLWRAGVPARVVKRIYG